MASLVLLQKLDFRTPIDYFCVAFGVTRNEIFAIFVRVDEHQIFLEWNKTYSVGYTFDAEAVKKNGVWIDCDTAHCGRAGQDNDR